MLTITTPAADASLLTVAERRAAVGLAPGDTSRDAELLALDLAIAEILANACRITQAGAAAPTFRVETLTETFRPTCARRAALMAARFPLVAITSVVEGTTTLAGADYEPDSAAGMFRRLSADRYRFWSDDLVTVVYTAGWATVPAGLKQAAAKLIGAVTIEAGRDPNLKRENIPGVIEQEWWVPPTADVFIPADVLDLLGPYKNPSVG